MTATRPRRPVSSKPRAPDLPPVRTRPTLHLPKVRLPKVRLPKVRLPKVRLPKVRLPKVRLPEISLPRISVPELRLPHLRAPGWLRHARSPVASTPEIPAVHPKIQSRRAAVARVERDLLGRRRTVLLAVAAVLTLAVGALFSPVLDVDRIRVGGVDGAPTDLVTTASGLEQGTALFSVMPAEVRRHVEAIGWVAHASVRTSWPDTVEIDVTPHRPLALMADDGGAASSLLTTSGRVLDLDEAGPLLAFTGGLRTVRLAAGAGAPEIQQALPVLRGLGPASSAALGEATLDGAGHLAFAGTGVLDGAEVAFGPLEQVPEKLQALEAALGGTVDLACTERLDVAVPSRVAIRRTPGCTLPETSAEAPTMATPETSSDEDR